MKFTVYIETSIPSFYHEIRASAEFVAMKNWTRQWWDSRKDLYQCFTSAAVLDELENGNHPRQIEKIRLLDELESLEVNDEIEEIVEVYISNYLMPKDVLGDALHLAIASFHKIDYLLTWNCSHLANANKKKHIRRINERLRLPTPEIITPLELLED
uniref:PIN domain-containing protein n=1 Tax=Candidatus Kentrum sp. UNK TaxID=2126344 RepID=A0A450ZXT9_9GAMM|nr:MAG: PIN domain-containing protein [Candidatus Kentron sp. UNK]VFK68495.1 MAG: PIN domain-containing protein [Candidatus Kentron sp. UNK]